MAFFGSKEVADIANVALEPQCEFYLRRFNGKERLGFTITAKKGHIFVSVVDIGSQAEMERLKVRDVVCDIEGVSCKGMDRDEFLAEVSKHKKNKKLNIIFFRGTKMGKTTQLLVPGGPPPMKHRSNEYDYSKDYHFYQSDSMKERRKNDKESSSDSDSDSDSDSASDSKKKKKKKGGKKKGGKKEKNVFEDSDSEEEQFQWEVEDIPTKHKERLYQNPFYSSTFDEQYGKGMAAKVVEEKEKKDAARLKKKKAAKAKGQDKEIPEAHIQMLLDNHDFAPKFDTKYGEGAAARILAQNAPTVDISSIPAAHVQKLIDAPSFAEKFDLKYGAGAAEAVFAAQQEKEEDNPFGDDDDDDEDHQTPDTKPKPMSAWP